MAFNKVILVGNISNEIELKQTQSGVSVCTFSIAVNRPHLKDVEPKCDFINIQAWRQTAEFISRYFTKGKPILVCGSLQTRTWTDNQGNKRYATEVVASEVAFVGSNDHESEAKSQTSVSSPSAYVPPAYSQPSLNLSQQFEAVPDDGTLPF